MGAEEGESGERRGRAGPPGPPTPAEATTDPELCQHPRLHRLGVQEIGVWPYRVHLVVCAVCGTTLTTESLRAIRRRAQPGRRGGGPPSVA